jgi:two-component system, NtrC family, response regulator AtoC
MSGRVLLVDDDPAMNEVLVGSLPGTGYQALARTSGEAALSLLETEDFDVVVTDLHMRGTNGVALCERIVANRPDIPVVVMTAAGRLESAVEAIRAGAYDFVTKPFDTKTLVVALDRAVQHRALRQEVRRLREQIDRTRPLPDLIGESAALRPVRDLIARLADSDASVLITGESGSGKELIASALHASSARRRGPFVAVNCAALPEPLLESELFGQGKGAFTDAKSPRAGLFAQASGGTLFLDDVVELPIALQAKLLRVLEQSKLRAGGPESETPADVRLVSATTRDLESAIEQRRFHEDLYFRLNVVQIAVPALRVRGNDILLLAQHFLERFAAHSGKGGKPVKGLAAAAAEKLLVYSWPGNVRELQNAMERAVALTRFEEISVDDLPEKIRLYQRSQVLPEASDPTELVRLEEVERRYILRVLEAVGGRRSDAARVLGIDRKTLYRKLEMWGENPRSES